MKSRPVIQAMFTTDVPLARAKLKRELDSRAFAAEVDAYKAEFTSGIIRHAGLAGSGLPDQAYESGTTIPVEVHHRSGLGLRTRRGGDTGPPSGSP